MSRKQVHAELILNSRPNPFRTLCTIPGEPYEVRSRSRHRTHEFTSVAMTARQVSVGSTSWPRGQQTLGWLAGRATTRAAKPHVNVMTGRPTLAVIPAGALPGRRQGNTMINHPLPWRAWTVLACAALAVWTSPWQVCVKTLPGPLAAR